MDLPKNALMLSTVPDFWLIPNPAIPPDALAQISLSGEGSVEFCVA